MAALLTELLARPIIHRAISPEAMTRELQSAGVPPQAAALLAAADQAIAAGVEDRTTDVVERLTGTAPRPLHEVLRDALAEAV